jgi:hypothetical protein
MQPWAFYITSVKNKSLAQKNPHNSKSAGILSQPNAAPVSLEIR